MLKILRNQKGQALAFVAVAMTALLAFAGLVTSYGMLTINKAQLQTAADAAALAGAQELVPSPAYSQANAKNTAREYARLSPGQLTDTVINLIVEQQSPTVSTLEITLSRPVATLLGAHTLQASAKAQAAAAGGIPPGTPPFAIVEPRNITWQGGPKGDLYSQPYTMRMNPAASTDFTYVNVVYKKPTSVQEYYDLITYGYNQPVTVNTTLYWVGPASGGQVAVESFAHRLQLPGNTDITRAQVGDPRLMLIPLLSSLPTTATNGPDWSFSTNGLKIQGFVGFWLDNLTFGPLINGTYPEFRATGRFVKVALPPGSPTVIGGEYFCLHQIHFIK
jgi:hypothetical protein